LLRFTVDGQLRKDGETNALKYGVLRISEVFLFFPKHFFCFIRSFLVADFALIVFDCALLVPGCALLDGSSCARSETLFSFFAG
jgi:hypothetical protein